MSASIEGLQELVDKVSKLTDDKITEKIQKKELKKHADSILRQMEDVTPVSKVRNIHGIDAENIVSYSYSGYKGYKIGITNQGGHGDAYWNQIRGVWFQQWKTDEPNYGWWTKLLDANKKQWLEEARESVKIALQEYLNSL